MGKTKKSPEERYKTIISKQKKMIQELKKKAARGEKVKQQFEEMELELAETFLEEEAKDRALKNDDLCPDCQKDNLEKLPLGAKKLLLCNSCSFRKVI